MFQQINDLICVLLMMNHYYNTFIAEQVNTDQLDIKKKITVNHFFFKHLVTL